MKVSVCLGTNCYLKGSQDVLNGVLRHAEQKRVWRTVSMCARASASRNARHGPTVMIDGEHMHHCTADKAIEEINSRIECEAPEHRADAESGCNEAE